MSTVRETDRVNQEPRGRASVKWLRRLGMAAFWFYLVKGLVWLGIFAFGGFAAANAVTGGS